MMDQAITDFQLVTKLQKTTRADKNEILMTLYERYRYMSPEGSRSKAA